MAYPFLPVNPCCTDVVLNTSCGCSYTITNGGCNNNDPCSTHLTASSTIVYDGPVLPCIVAEPCDTLNVILQKIDEIICNLQTQINYLTNQVANITNQVININGDILNIYNTLGECCSATTTSTSTTVRPCENFSLTNTGDDPVAIIITDCTTQEQEAIVLMPGATNICVITDSPLTVPGTVIVTPNGPCAPLTTTTTSSSTTSTTSTSSTTTTTTTAIPCECLTFSNTDSVSHLFSYTNCLGEFANENEIAANEIIQVCGCCGLADSEFVTISIGANCIDDACPTTTTTTTIAPTTTTTTTVGPTTTTTSSSSTSTTSTSSTTSTTTTITPTTSTTTTIDGTLLVQNNSSSVTVDDVYALGWSTTLIAPIIAGTSSNVAGHNSTYNPINVSVSTVGVGEHCMILFVNGSFVEDIQFNTNGIYSFNSILITSADIILVTVQDGNCA